MDVDDVHTDFIDLSNTGLLWLINRVVFHPRGYKLALICKDGTREVEGWTLQGDGSEVCVFSESDDDAEFAKVNEFFDMLTNRSLQIQQENYIQRLEEILAENPPFSPNDVRRAMGLSINPPEENDG